MAGYRVAASFPRCARIRGGVAILVDDDVECVPLSLADCCVGLMGILWESGSLIGS